MSDLADFFFSAAPSVVRYQLIELSHPNFTQTYRLVRNATEGVYVKHEGSSVPTFYTYMPMRIDEIGSDNSLDQSMDVTFGDLGSILPFEIDLISNANSMGTKPVLTYREARSDEMQMEGVAGGDWVFDGTDDNVTIGDETALDITDPFSVTGWFKADPSFLSIGNILTKFGTLGWGMRMFNGALHVELKGISDFLALETVNQYNDNQWHFFAVTKTSSASASGIRVYVDGFQVSVSVSRDALAGSMLTSQPLRIGAEGASAIRPFRGTLKHIALWNKRLSQAEIIEVFGGGSPPDLGILSFFGNALAWWRLDFSDTIGLAGIVDQTGNNHDGTAQGGLNKQDTVFGPVIQQPIFGPLTLEVTSVSFNKQGAVFTAKPKSFNMARTGEFYSVERFPMLAGFL